MPKQSHYDVIIVGGGTAGCAAAYTAGKLGLSTLLVEKNIHLGGSITSGLVVPAMQSSENQINTEFFDALISQMQSIDGQITYQNNPGWFNPELCKIALDRLMAKANVEVLFNSNITAATYNEQRIKSLTLSTGMLSVSIAASNVVDTTGNCEICAMANCKFINENEKNADKKFQPLSLRFMMGGIDLKCFGKWLLDFDSDRNVTTVEHINGQMHLSTACTWDTDSTDWALTPLFDDAVANNILKDADRSYFQVFTVPNMFDTLAFNCPRFVFDTEIDPLNSDDTSQALQKGRESILRIADFCKIYFPGFKNAYISNIADTLGVRVSRRIVGKYVYTADDLKSGKKFKNPVVIGNYPIDIHSSKKSKSQLVHTMQDYQLPVESLISADYDNLFVAGRCLSADFEAQGALRIQPSCFSMGEGIAKHIANLLSKNKIV